MSKFTEASPLKQIAHNRWMNSDEIKFEVGDLGSGLFKVIPARTISNKTSKPSWVPEWLAPKEAEWDLMSHGHDLDYTQKKIPKRLADAIWRDGSIIRVRHSKHLYNESKLREWQVWLAWVALKLFGWYFWITANRD